MSIPCIDIVARGGARQSWTADMNDHRDGSADPSAAKDLWNHARARVLAIGALAVERLEATVAALYGWSPRHDGQGANVAADAGPDPLDAAFEQLFSARTPDASDTRFLLALSRIGADLERIRVDCQRFEELRRNRARDELLPLPAALRHAVESAAERLRGALAAIESHSFNTTLTREPSLPDLRRCREAELRQLVTYTMERPELMPLMLNTLALTRALEQISAHVGSVCETVICLLTDDGRPASRRERLRAWRLGEAREMAHAN
ncbi:MAG: hypothetical protein AB7Q97_16395 [Gammaproteobacteria bacterium]